MAGSKNPIVDPPTIMMMMTMMMMMMMMMKLSLHRKADGSFRTHEGLNYSVKAGLNLKFDQNVDIFLFFKSYASGTEECYGKCFRVNFALFRCWRIVLLSAVEKQFRLPW